MQDRDATGIRRGLRLLRGPDFARLFSARLVSAFGSAMAPVAMAFAVLDLTGSPAAMGLVIASQTGAQVLVQLFGGALADRGSRQRMIVLADGLAMSAQASIALLLLSGAADVPVLCALMAVNGIAFALHWPASVGIVPQVVEVERLQAANGLLSLAQSGALALGAATAGVLVATVGAAWAIALDCSTFAASALLVAGLHVREQERGAPASLFQDLRDGWTEFTSHRWLWTIVLQFSVMLAAWQASYAVIGPTVAQRWLGGATDWGLIAGALGAGLLAGGLLALRVRVERPMLVATFCVFLNAIPVVLLSIPAPVPAIAAGAFLAGAGGQMFGVLWYTTLHTHVAPAALSRVSAYDILGSIALVPLGEAAAGPLIEWLGIAPTLWLAAILIVLPTAAVLAVPEVRTLRTRVASLPEPGVVPETGAARIPPVVPIHCNFSLEQELVTVEISGPLTYARCLGILELIREDERHQPHYRILVDARGIDYSPTVEEVRRIAAALGERRAAFKGRMAVVLDPGPTFDLGQLCARFARGEGFTMACFGAIPQALAWFEKRESGD